MGDTKYPPEWVDAIKALYPCMIMFGNRNIVICFTHADHRDAAKAMCLLQGLTCTESTVFSTPKYPYVISVRVEQEKLFA